MRLLKWLLNGPLKQLSATTPENIIVMALFKPEAVAQSNIAQEKNHPESTEKTRGPSPNKPSVYSSHQI